MGRLCYPTQHRAGSWYFSQKVVTVQEGYGTCFCRHGTNFITSWRDRGTILIGAASLSPVTNLVTGTSAVSRYNLSRSQKTVKVYRNLIACRCACPGATTFTNLSWVQEQSKNRDKQLTHIVRVSRCIFIF